MNILYLHGYKSSSGCEKVKWLQGEGHHVVNPQINYDDKRCFLKLFEFMSTPISMFYYQKIDLIIGSSMGGYFAYELGKHFDIEVILFNPAFDSRPVEPEMEKPGQCDPLVTLAVGENDTVIDYEDTLKYLDENAACFFRPNYFRGKHGHRTPIDFFKKVFYFSNSIKPTS
jgi:hypothetical protein|tara:strand:+ start:538 stop:1050 length:513 start_codon:yes stop_codon:yes gene_type:complete